jgi:tetratricopeptide (TPR) repeat protein
LSFVEIKDVIIVKILELLLKEGAFMRNCFLISATFLFITFFHNTIQADVNDNINKFGIANPSEEGKKCFLLYYGRDSVRKDTRHAFELAKSLSEKGDPIAFFILGKVFDIGDPEEENTETAVEWYTKAAEQGNALAQTMLGNCYFTKVGDATKAIGWYQKAAEQGNVDAQKFISSHQGLVQAIEYKKSAEQGDANAQSSLAGCYENGTGVQCRASLIMSAHNL